MLDDVRPAARRTFSQGAPTMVGGVRYSLKADAKEPGLEWECIRNFDVIKVMNEDRAVRPSS
ncbi:MAG: hypothetical protein Q4C81_06240 [Kocuria sp.]|nr:hypothetical protein [Kocuria sp.]